MQLPLIHPIIILQIIILLLLPIYQLAPSANFTLALHNSAASTTKTSVYTLIYANSGKYYPTTLNIYSDAGSTSISCTTVWLNGTPSISSATVSVLTISVMKALSSNYALCSLANYY